jgi:hypothetical protein
MLFEADIMLEQRTLIELVTRANFIRNNKKATKYIPSCL